MTSHTLYWPSVTFQEGFNDLFNEHSNLIHIFRYLYKCAHFCMLECAKMYNLQYKIILLYQPFHKCEMYVMALKKCFSNIVVSYYFINLKSIGCWIELFKFVIHLFCTFVISLKASNWE